MASADLLSNPNINREETDVVDVIAEVASLLKR